MQQTWVSDGADNRCSIERWGSETAAREALASCQDCSGCQDCQNCYACQDCQDCERCQDLSRCQDCQNCSRCFCSQHCQDCNGCSRCSRCQGCQNCWRCSDGWGIRDAVVPVPSIPAIHQAVYAACSTPGALSMHRWHTCDTTHCRAGWVVQLAGKAGAALETIYGTLLAAQLIYRESGAPINPCRFFDSDADALADMARLAGATKVNAS